MPCICVNDCIEDGDVLGVKSLLPLYFFTIFANKKQLTYIT